MRGFKMTEQLWFFHPAARPCTLRASNLKRNRQAAPLFTSPPLPHTPLHATRPASNLKWNRQAAPRLRASPASPSSSPHDGSASTEAREYAQKNICGISLPPHFRGSAECQSEREGIEGGRASCNHEIISQVPPSASPGRGPERQRTLRQVYLPRKYFCSTVHSQLVSVTCFAA
jgi:hypothetical protein